MKFILKLSLMFLIGQVNSKAQDLTQIYYVENDRILKRELKKCEVVNQEISLRKSETSKVLKKQQKINSADLPLKVIDVSKTIFVGQKQAVSFTFSK